MESASSDGMDVLQSTLNQQGAVIDQHSSLLAAASRDFLALSNRLSELSDRLQLMQPGGEPPLPVPSVVSPSTDREPHTATPPTYDGDPNTCRAFLQQ